MFTTTEAKPRAPDEARVDLFGCPAWTAKLDLPADHLPSMLTDIETRLAELRSEGFAPQHTGPVFQDRSEPWWADYHAALLKATDVFATALDHPWTERTLSTSGVRYENPTDDRLGDSLPPSRLDTTYSCVFDLSLPDAHQDTPNGTTLVRNPMASLLTSIGEDAEWQGPSMPLQGIILPGFLEHRAAPPSDPDEQWNTPRVTLVSDVAYY